MPSVFGSIETNLIGFSWKMDRCDMIFNMQIEIYRHKGNYSISRSVCVHLYPLHLTCDSSPSQNLTCVTYFEACHIQYHCRFHDLTHQRVKVWLVSMGPCWWMPELHVLVQKAFSFLNEILSFWMDLRAMITSLVLQKIHHNKPPDRWKPVTGKLSLC